VLGITFKRKDREKEGGQREREREGENLKTTIPTRKSQLPNLIYFILEVTSPGGTPNN
jgi:hypothetical protein